ARLLPDPQAVALAIVDEARSGALAFNPGATPRYAHPGLCPFFVTSRLWEKWSAGQGVARSMTMHAPQPLRRSASEATAPIPSSTIPVPGSLPTLPSGRMNLVLPLGKQSSGRAGTTTS